MSRRFPKISEAGLRLREKQKMRYHYGLGEKQLRLIYQRAKRMKGDTGRNMVAQLEARLDNLVWRAGLTRTVPAARQLVAHGHVELNGHRAKTPSQQLQSGDVFKLLGKAASRDDIRLSANNPVLEPPPGLKIDLDTMTITVEALPAMEQCPVEIDIQKVIEFYSR